MESIYGEYKDYLPLIMENICKIFREFNDRRYKETGCKAYEHLSCRIKAEESMREKCQRKGLEESPYSALHELKDAIGIRAVCGFVDDIYALVDFIKYSDKCVVVKEKDYIKHAKSNGYRSYHMIINFKTKFPDVDGNENGNYFAEIQLRTIAMDSWASLEHQMKYKKNISNQELIERELKRCADELAACDISMQTIRSLIRNGD